MAAASSSKDARVPPDLDGAVRAADPVSFQWAGGEFRWAASEEATLRPLPAGVPPLVPQGPPPDASKIGWLDPARSFANRKIPPPEKTDNSSSRLETDFDALSRSENPVQDSSSRENAATTGGSSHEHVVAGSSHAPSAINASPDARRSSPRFPPAPERTSDVPYRLLYSEYYTIGWPAEDKKERGPTSWAQPSRPEQPSACTYFGEHDEHGRRHGRGLEFLFHPRDCSGGPGGGQEGRGAGNSLFSAKPTPIVRQSRPTATRTTPYGRTRSVGLDALDPTTKSTSHHGPVADRHHDHGLGSKRAAAASVDLAEQAPAELSDVFGSNVVTSQYIGLFQNGLRQGRGELTLASGCRYVGIWDRGYAVSGVWIPRLYMIPPLQREEGEEGGRSFSHKNSYGETMVLLTIAGCLVEETVAS